MRLANGKRWESECLEEEQNWKEGEEEYTVQVIFEEAGYLLVAVSSGAGRGGCRSGDDG